LKNQEFMVHFPFKELKIWLERIELFGQPQRAGCVLSGARAQLSRLWQFDFCFVDKKGKRVSSHANKTLKGGSFRQKPKKLRLTFNPRHCRG
jgi:hypothetical protein